MPPATSFALPSVQEKPTYVQNLFARVASYYDMMNDVMSFGLHRLWKRQACRKLALPRNGRVLDVCSGTGDLAVMLHRQYPTVAITALDFCPEMLAIGQRRAVAQGVPAAFEQGDALALPYADNAFDGVIIGYGLRNVAHYDRCLSEMVRVVKPGGYVVVLDMSHPKGLANVISGFYRFTIMPLMGKCVANDPDAYRYLANSIFFYPDQSKLAHMMAEAGLGHVAYENKLGGICALHWGQKSVDSPT
ncbi:MAG: bifunctional demethylmenaquinone methyltransferase/2-methoxy-6-polyprenyl-1,4-benzoquinol methylase UbiE [Cyanobacteria bacterium HKST-UBA05]|nr:bifunctional demethylmenaquinone methyltransferase/2-methoxy-6-polyprenyl-1,4-benzoquinol methylase UbiE [Cyanobacteria bacterium HKST-UBA05]